MQLIDAHTLLLALLSLARTLILHEAPGMTIPLAAITPESFADTTWKELGMAGAQRDQLFRQLATMFPGRSPCSRAEPPPCKTPGETAEAVFSDWLRGSRQVIYSSSGSSGAPKLLPHSCELIRQEVDCLAGIFPAVRHVLGVTPQHHCYGFIFGVLLHRRLGATYSLQPPLPTIVRHALRENTLVVGYPDLWKRIHTAGYKPPPGLICLSAGSPWPDASIRNLRSNGYNILEIYGSSENGAIGWRDGPQDFKLLSYWHKKKDDPGLPLPELLRELPSGEKIGCRLQDTLVWSGERSFRPLKRLDSAVQVSGMNVYPSLVAALIEEHPEVMECRVRPMREEEGCRLKAFVVARPECQNPERLRRELKQLCQSRLSSPARPVHFSFGPEIPRNDFGKECDWKIR